MKMQLFNNLPVGLAGIGLATGIGAMVISNFAPDVLAPLLWTFLITGHVLGGSLMRSYLKRIHLNSAIDPLTGVMNRSAFTKRLDYEMESSKRNRRTMMLAVVDIDNFKYINDCYGHSAGDQVLMDMVTVFQENTRERDTVARFGGDEFIIILPDTGMKEARALLERLESKVALHHFVDKVTISIGIAQYQQGIDAKQLIDLADKSMYKAKGSKKAVKNVAQGLSGSMSA